MIASWQHQVFEGQFILLIVLSVIVFACISLHASNLTRRDKRAALNQGWRVSELRLLVVGILGGALFMWVTMVIIRHKTRKPLFMWGLPLLAVLHLGFLAVLWWLSLSRVGFV